MPETKYLDDLLDVEVPAPSDGQVLYWDAPTALWKAKTILVAAAIIERVVRYSTDDAWAYYTGADWVINLTYALGIAGYYGATYQGSGMGMRFVNIYLPPTAIITHAYLKLTCGTAGDKIEVKTRIRGEKNVDPLTFSTIDDYNARTRTTATIDWDNIPTWQLGELYQSPDIKDVIKEIITLPDWASGNPLVIFWDDHDFRTPPVAGKDRRARSQNHATPVPPILYIEYTPYVK